MRLNFYQTASKVWLGIVLIAAMWGTAGDDALAQRRKDERNFAVATTSTRTGSRVALVIGNQAYARKPLQNPVNDAQDMRAALERLGFEVIYRKDADLPALDQAVHEFTRKLGKDAVGLVYYSGHGAQADGVNYLIPVRTEIGTKAELKARAYDANIILGEMQEAGNRVNILILDACRDNPFKGFKGGADGLATMTGPKGSLIAFATAPESTADDNPSERNGLYTKYLKRYLVQPGLRIEEVFKKVRESVVEENPEQVPWENSSIIGDFCFAGCGGADMVAEPAPVPAAPDPATVELAFWNSIQDSDNPAGFEEYLSQYPRGRFAGLARNRMKRLNQIASAPPEARPPVVAAEPPPPRYRPEPTPTSSAAPFGIEMVRLPGLGIAMGKYEVTQGQWRAVMGNNPSYFKDCGDDCPVEAVSWNDVQDFLERLNAKTGGGYRLPTEREWESACLAGKRTEYCGSDEVEAVAWYDGNSGNRTHPVGRKRANGYGLYDMSGNVWEWTADCWEGDCSSRVLRGGSWSDLPGSVRSANRGRNDPSYRSDNNGFRVAQD